MKLRPIGRIMRVQKVDQTYRATIPQEGAATLGLTAGGQYVQFYKDGDEEGVLVMKRVEVETRGE